MQEQDGRRARSQRSRVKIVEAGRPLFVEHGYVATTMESIADRADVAVQTVYHLFGGKPALLAAILDTSIVGDHEAVPLAGRQWFDRLESLTEPAAAIAHLVDECVSILERVAPVYAVVRHASADPEVRRIFDATRAGRRADHRRLVGILHRNRVLRPALDVDRPPTSSTRSSARTCSCLSSTTARGPSTDSERGSSTPSPRRSPDAPGVKQVPGGDAISRATRRRGRTPASAGSARRV